MSHIHIYRAKDQPAIRYWVDLSTFTKGGRLKKAGFWSESRPREMFYCSKCRKRRWALNLIVHVYYDETRFFCRKGKGCAV